MSRTIVTLHENDKRWLKGMGHLEHKSTSEIIRQAIKKYREWMTPKMRRDALCDTSGLWKHRGKDALKWTKQLRDEWDRL